jgi:hypothetical protein
MRSRLSRHLRLLAAVIPTTSVGLVGITGVLGGTVSGPLGVSTACGCEGGGEGEGGKQFTVRAAPTSLKGAGSEATVTVENISGKEPAEVVAIKDKGTNVGDFLFNDLFCINKYAVTGTCSWQVTYNGTTSASLTFEVEDELHHIALSPAIKGSP